MREQYITALFLGIFLLFFILDVGLIISILKKGDERRQLIIYKSSNNTLSILIGMLILDSISKLLISTELNNLNKIFNGNSNSFYLLTITAIIYFSNLKNYQKKYGD